MRASPNNKKLAELIEQARTGLITLPQFQRNFVWPRRSIESLLSSLLRGHYIGALLFLETDQEHMPFGFRPMAGIETSSNNTHPDDLVLDGQQRITALHYAFAAPNHPLRDTNHPYRFFLRLYRLEDIEDGDDLIVSGRASDHWVKQLENPEIQFQWKNLPFTEVLRWEDWSKEYSKWLFNQDQQAGMEHHVDGERDRWDEAVRRIRDAEVPVVTLDKVSPDDHPKIRQICEVFEKLNSTGLKLTVFDLMTARLYRDNVDLHWLWRYSLQSYPLLRRFAGGEPNVEEANSDDFGVLLLRTVALLREQEVKSKRLIELDPHNFEEDWERASEAMERALERVTSTAAEGFGVFNRRWLPYKTILPVLAAITENLRETNAGADAYGALRRWYWASVFLGRYTGATETVAYADFLDIMRYVRGEKAEPNIFDEARSQIVHNTGFSLRGTARVSAADYKGVMNLIALGGAKDFANNDGITFQELDDHHIFPQAFLRNERGITG
ncbi:MAG: GmrSD restriction endonuclease domain-containing protein, partial [Rubrobacteraceae bacterium]